MAYIKSWFNETAATLFNEGVVIDNRLVKAQPIKSGKTFRKGTCPICGSKNGFVFAALHEKGLYILACLRCGEYSARKVDNGDSKVRKNQCKGVTKAGNRCRSGAMKNGFCGVHQDQVSK